MSTRLFGPRQYSDRAPQVAVANGTPPTIPFQNNSFGLGAFLLSLLAQLKIREYDPNYYVFGLEGVPGPEPKDVNHFYRKHRTVLETLKIRGRYTLYGWKHTGNIKLFKATGNLSANQKQNGHASPRTTEIYLSKMGQIADAEILEKFI